MQLVGRNPGAARVVALGVVFIAVISALLLTGRAGSPPTSPRVRPTVLIPNGALRAGTASRIDHWRSASYGTNDTAFSVSSRGASSGSRAAVIVMSNHQDGDAKWIFDPIPVEPGHRYEFSDRYQSDVFTELDAEFTMASGQVQFALLAHLPPNTDRWSVAGASVVAPAGAVRLTVIHLIATNGALETSDHRLRDATTSQATVTRFKRPLVSIEFDDGFESAYRSGLPIVESFGWRATMNVITDTAEHNSSYDAGMYMTPAEVVDWKRRGDIGSHTVHHPHLPALGPGDLNAELATSRTYLDSLLGAPVRLFVTPYCESDPSVTSVARSLYETQRNCRAEPNVAATFDRYDLTALSLTSSTSLADIRDQLVRTKHERGWLILVWHRIDASSGEYAVSPARLTAQLEAVRASGIHVELPQDALDQIVGR